MDIPVGLRFRPTDLEIVDVFLRPKNLNRNTRDADEFISTVTIRSFDPWELPSQSKIKLKDRVWCFFSRKENKYERGERQIRKTKSGYWKITGKPKDIIRNRQKIGHKRVLMFYFGKTPNGSKSDWVMHEYHLFSPNQVMMTYTLCKVMFKGEETEVSSSSSSAASEIEHTHSLSLIPLVNNSGGSEVSSFHNQELQNPTQSSAFLDLLEEDPIVDDPNTPSEEWKSWLLDDEQLTIMCLQDDRNDHRPQKPLTGVFTDYNSDDSHSGLISATTNSIGTSSTCDSFGSSNHRVDQITNLQESPNSTIELMSLTQEVSQALRTSIDTSEKKNPNDDAQGTDIGDLKLGQKPIKNKRAGFFYRMIQKFVKKIQLCSSISRT
ncbi:NAC domain-containing protein 3 [Cardamine amara subsp. amara]|uniref:NAC domain-containing protein 3 n=1 Tax=Cardamine amara subsp. amara TaxID=228776 RepID=A0ABD1BT17_CARAN